MIALMKKVRIAILDSGVCKDHSAFKNKTICGFSLCVENGKVNYYDDFSDDIGHGTAVFYLIERKLKDVCITNIKIYDDRHDLDQNNFTKLLDYIYLNYEFDIINISMGFIQCGNISLMQRICDKFHKRGTIIVSAFDNNGAVSFPAGLDNVIGVDCQEIGDKGKEYILVENSIVSVIGQNKNMRVAWKNPEYILVKGSSFICANITSKIAESIQKYSRVDLHNLCDDVYTLPKPIINRLDFKLNRVAIFPFNKEMHAIARFEELLACEIVDYYSLRIMGQVGRNMLEVISDCGNNKSIKDIESIDWDSLDTLVIGHTGALRRLTGVDYKSQLIRKCVQNKKNIYSFDKPCAELSQLCSQNNIGLYSPEVNSDNIKRRYGKLYKTDKPIVTVIGTNSSQGKFSFQLYFRKRLIELGYQVGQIGTEPSALLFGFDEVFPCGYNGQIALDIPQTYIAVNDMLWSITQKENVDIIIAGVQSGFLAYNDRNAMMSPVYHRIFFDALQSDALILCINPFDDIDFIKRCIMAAEGISGAKVIGLVCFPIDASNSWTGLYSQTKRISIEKELHIKSICYNQIEKQVYILDKKSELDDLIAECISYLSSQ